MSTLQLLAIGEVMAELRRGQNDSFDVGYAGDTFNTAVYCARQLKQNNAVAYMTRVGPDPLSTDLLAMAAQEDIDMTHVVRDEDKMLGIYAVTTDDAGERSFSYWRENSAARQQFQTDNAIKAMPASRIVYLSGISLAILTPEARRRLMDHLDKLAKSDDTLVAFDSNYRPKLWESKSTAQSVIGEMWDIANIALPSIDDEMALFGETTEDAVFDRFSKGDWTACAIKRGEQGPLSVAGEYSADNYKAANKVVDTTAAGDSFNGGYLSAYLQGENEEVCLCSGHDLAALVIGHPGAIIKQ